MLEKQVDTIMGKKMNLETQIMALEEAVMNVEVVDVIIIYFFQVFRILINVGIFPGCKCHVSDPSKLQTPKRS